MSEALVLGADVGGTSAKAALIDAAGRVLGRGRAAGGNVNSSDGDPAENIGAALREALGDHDPTRVVAGMIGMAGSAAVPDRARRVADAAWRAARLTGSPSIGTDLDIAYAAGATGGDGVLLLAGTGAVSAAFTGYRLTKRCDGLGWLLGDEGSAVWLGIEGLRAAVAAFDGRGPDTALAAAMVARLAPDSPTGDPRQDLVAAAFRVPAARLGELAPTVVAAAADGDPVAERIVTAGCAALVRTASVVADEPRCLVLAGSLLTSPGLVAHRVRTDLAARFGVDPVVAPDPVAGALLAALRAAGLPVPPELPDRLRAALDTTPRQR
ncbi:N-acetylglucosamine kinase [Actinocatenispora thailandica]|uniref:N-acetylglucosamine kinase n=1 Tax=Actinocatenispora thailandica TaxID=227318 RepID=A0A7R7HVF0_9ACTN|nr:BadF/BadG/BcrA/BcrD ATPase family protein [Actinocatenispora thailandica]BCJ32809.1 N-acetylglucosamine kinase [Actinocatenispora thailandica]